MKRVGTDQLLLERKIHKDCLERKKIFAKKNNTGDIINLKKTLFISSVRCRRQCGNKSQHSMLKSSLMNLYMQGCLQTCKSLLGLKIEYGVLDYYIFFF